MRILREIAGHLPDIGKEVYYTVPGSANVAYHTEVVRPNFPVVLVDEEFDVATLEAAAKEIVVGVALGGLQSARTEELVNLLKQASIVLLCLPKTDAGDEAMQWWSQHLPNSKAWRVPRQYININDMHVKKTNITHWLQSGIEEGLIL